MGNICHLRSRSICKEALGYVLDQQNPPHIHRVLSDSMCCIRHEPANTDGSVLCAGFCCQAWVSSRVNIWRNAEARSYTALSKSHMLFCVVLTIMLHSPRLLQCLPAFDWSLNSARKWQVIHSNTCRSWRINDENPQKTAFGSICQH